MRCGIKRVKGKGKRVKRETVRSLRVLTGLTGSTGLLLFGAVRYGGVMQRMRNPANKKGNCALYKEFTTNYTNERLCGGDGVYLFVSQARQSNARHAGILKAMRCALKKG